MVLKCIAIDKELSALELIGNYIDAIPVLTLLQTFDDVLAAGEFMRKNKIDLLFIEVGMPHNAAIRLVKSIREKPLIIFTVGCKQLPREVLNLDVLDYIVKPITLERFLKSVVKAIDNNQTRITKEETIFIRSTYQLVRINLDEIEYIESVENYIKIHLADGKSVMTLMTLKVIMEKLPPGKFVRIHRCYIIPVDKIKYIGNKKIRLNITELPVSGSYSVNLKTLINK